MPSRIFVIGGFLPPDYVVIPARQQGKTLTMNEMRLQAAWREVQMQEEKRNDAICLGCLPEPVSLPHDLKPWWPRLPLSLRQRWWKETGYCKVTPSYTLLADMFAARNELERSDAQSKGNDQPSGGAEPQRPDVGAGTDSAGLPQADGGGGP